MTTLRWSGFFIYSLLVLPGHASNDSQKAEADNRRSITRNFIRSLSSDKAIKDNAGPIAISVIIGTLLLISLIFFSLYLRKRKRAGKQIEDGVTDAAPEKPEWWHIDLGSAKGTNWWVLETKGGGDEGKRKSLDEGRPIKADILPWARFRHFLTGEMGTRQKYERRSKVFRLSFPPAADENEYVARPRPAASNLHPRYPSILDRPGNPPSFPPPSPYKNKNPARTILAVESREKSGRREAQIFPKAVNFNGRSLPGTPELKLGLPRSLSGQRRRSWLARQNPFFLLKESDAVLPRSATAGLTLREGTKSPQGNPHSIINGLATSSPHAPLTGNKKRIPVPVYVEEQPRRSPGLWEAPGTGVMPRPKYQVYERALRSVPLGDHPTSALKYPRSI